MQPPLHPLPARAVGGADAQARFRTALAATGADLVEVAAPDAVPAAVADYLQARGLPGRFRRAAGPLLDALPWPAAGRLTIDIGPASDGDAVGLSQAVAGVAETGTLVLVSGPQAPVALAFLPETHIVLLSAADIIGSYEEALGRVRRDGGMPRTVNLITGASRTGDIGGRIVMGAHGPRRLAVFIIGV